MKKILLTCLLIMPVITTVYAQKKNKKKAPVSTTPAKMLNTEMDSVSYSIGISIANNLKNQGFDSLNGVLIGKAIDQVLANQPTEIDAQTAEQFLNNYFQQMQAKKVDAQKSDGEKFLAENAKKPGVTTTASGLQYEVITMGTGAKPGPTDKVTTHYHGTLIDGTIFDSSVQRGQPASFPLDGVIKGWTEALQLMPVGSKWRLFLPYDLAYGERGAGGQIAPYSALIFEVELISIDK